LKLIPRSELDTAVRKHKAQRNAKEFSCWEQFAAMLFCPLGSVTIRRGFPKTDSEVRRASLKSSDSRLVSIGLPVIGLRVSTQSKHQGAAH
jgi:hypothetical protein